MVNQYKEKIRRFDCAVKIVILDDELEFSKILDKKIKEYCARKDLLYDCQIFSSGKTLLEDDLSSIQVAFLDIDMPEFNGLDVAKVLHQRYPEMILIFVTFFIKYAHSYIFTTAIQEMADVVLIDLPDGFIPYNHLSTADFGVCACRMFSVHIPVRKTHKLLCTHGKAWLSLSSIRSLHCNQIRLLLESCFY